MMLSATIAGLSLLLATSVVAQKSSVTCTAPDFAWSSNDKGQDTCLIAAYLRAACQPNPTSFDLGPSASGHYGPPTDVTKCTCSMVYYNTINACSLCGGNRTLSWTDSIKPCQHNDVTVAGYPLPIPTNITIPAWAFMDITKADVFKADAAEAFSQTNNTMFSADDTSTSAISVPPVTASSSTTAPSKSPSPPTSINTAISAPKSPTASPADANNTSTSTQSTQQSTQSSAAKSHEFNAGVVVGEVVISVIAVLTASVSLPSF